MRIISAFIRGMICGVYNIESCNFSFSDEEQKRYYPRILYTHSGQPFYEILITPLEFIFLKIKFWKMRRDKYCKIRIKIIK